MEHIGIFAPPRCNQSLTVKTGFGVEWCNDRLCSTNYDFETPVSYCRYQRWFFLSKPDQAEWFIHSPERVDFNCTLRISIAKIFEKISGTWRGFVRAISKLSNRSNFFRFGLFQLFLPFAHFPITTKYFGELKPSTFPSLSLIGLNTRPWNILFHAHELLIWFFSLSFHESIK